MNLFSFSVGVVSDMGEHIYDDGISNLIIWRRLIAFFPNNLS